MYELNVAVDVNTAFDTFLKEEVIFDHECSACLHKQASVEKRVVVTGKYIIVQMKRFLLYDGGWVKDVNLVKCVGDQLSLSVGMDDEVRFPKAYHLVASICHSGTLAAGHYTAHILHKGDDQWLLCNDKAVIPINSLQVDSKYNYVLFYELS